MKKNLPIDISDFKVLIKNNNYNKVKLTEDLSNEMNKILLFTRPHKFKKVLNILMLKYFFVENTGEEKKYYTELKARVQNIIKLGMTFCDKKVKVVYE